LNDYDRLDIRSSADYAAVHIAGAVNVELGNGANPEVLAKRPTNNLS
jgi:rhodanese-related sulfurtransferase